MTSCCNAAFTPRTGAVSGVQVFAYDTRRNDTSNPDSPIVGFCSLLGSSTCAATQAGGQWEILNADQSGPADPGENVMNTVTSPTFGNAACGEGVGQVAK